MKRRSDYWRERKRAREANAAFYSVFRYVRESQTHRSPESAPESPNQAHSTGEFPFLHSQAINGGSNHANEA